MKIIIRVLLFINGFLAVFIELHGQNLDEHQLDVITKNILSYHIRYALNYDLNLKSDNVLQGSNYFFNELWPKGNQNLKFEVLTCKIKYPLKAINVFIIKKRDFQIGNDSIRISKRLTSFQADDIYLVGLDLMNHSLKFISGNFFHSSIYSDFDLHIDRPETFIDYLLLRTYNWSIEKIEFKRIKNGKLVFKGFSKFLKENVHILVDLTDFDEVKVTQLKRKITY